MENLYNIIERGLNSFLSNYKFEWINNVFKQTNQSRLLLLLEDKQQDEKNSKHYSSQLFITKESDERSKSTHSSKKFIE